MDAAAAPTGADPLKALLSSYDVHVPASVIGELSTATGSGDLLSAAADCFEGVSSPTTYDVEAKSTSPSTMGWIRASQTGFGSRTLSMRRCSSPTSSTQRTTCS